MTDISAMGPKELIKPTQGIVRLWLLKEIMMRYKDYTTMKLPYTIRS